MKRIAVSVILAGCLVSQEAYAGGMIIESIKAAIQQHWQMQKGKGEKVQKQIQPPQTLLEQIVDALMEKTPHKK